MFIKKCPYCRRFMIPSTGVHKKCLSEALKEKRYEFGILKERREEFDKREYDVFEQNGRIVGNQDIS